MTVSQSSGAYLCVRIACFGYNGSWSSILLWNPRSQPTFWACTLNRRLSIDDEKL